MKKIFFATPSYDGRLEGDYVTSLAATRRLLEQFGHETFHQVWMNDSFIDRARNRLLREFLASDATHIWFVDADVAWGPIGAARMVNRNLPFVAGVYPRRQEPRSWPARVVRESDGKLLVDKGTVPAHHVPGGFMLLERGVIEAMAERYPDLWFADADFGGAKTPLLFQVLWDLHTCTGEDIVFCARWRSMGGQIRIEPDIDFKHIGGHRFAGNFHQALSKGEA